MAASVDICNHTAAPTTRLSRGRQDGRGRVRLIVGPLRLITWDPTDVANCRRRHQGDVEADVFVVVVVVVALHCAFCNNLAYPALQRPHCSSGGRIGRNRSKSLLFPTPLCAFRTLAGVALPREPAMNTATFPQTASRWLARVSANHPVERCTVRPARVFRFYLGESTTVQDLSRGKE